MSLEANETGNLIGSDKVEGTAVYGSDSNKIGSIERVMIDKKSGRVSYAVLSFGGFLGIGEKYHPLPWSTLHYDESMGGYVVNVDRKMLEDAPTYDANDDFRWTPDYGQRVDKYYNAPSFWPAV